MTPRPYNPTRDRIPSKAAPMQKRNLFTPDGAQELAYELDEWWHSRGFPQVRHWVEKARVSARKEIAVVCSNLVNGVPPKEAK